MIPWCNDKRVFKASRHVIFPAWFANVSHVKTFVHQSILPRISPDWVGNVKDVASKDHKRAKGVDKGVYTKNRPFRFYMLCTP